VCKLIIAAAAVRALAGCANRGGYGDDDGGGHAGYQHPQQAGGCNPQMAAGLADQIRRTLGLLRPTSRPATDSAVCHNCPGWSYYQMPRLSRGGLFSVRRKAPDRMDRLTPVPLTHHLAWRVAERVTFSNPSQPRVASSPAALFVVNPWLTAARAKRAPKWRRPGRSPANPATERHGSARNWRDTLAAAILWRLRGAGDYRGERGGNVISGKQVQAGIVCGRYAADLLRDVNRE
jgi:hypothetical protein